MECSGQQARHCVCGDQYVKISSSHNTCFTQQGSFLLLCDECLTFWWECRENRDQMTWGTAMFFREQVNGAPQSEAEETHAHVVN